MKLLVNLLVTALVLAGLAFAAFPYYTVYQLDAALVAGDRQALGQLVDMAAVRAQRKAELRRDTDRLIGEGKDDVSAFFREGARALTDSAVNNIIDQDWLRTRLRRDGKPGSAKPYPSLMSSLSYAFFDAWNGFLMRQGELGDDPVHIRMEFADWRWRVVAVHD